MWFAFFLKWLLVLLIMAAGVSLLLAGLNIEIPLIKFKGLEAYGVPVGIIVMVAGIALAYFWQIKIETETVSTSSKTRSGSKISQTIKTKTNFIAKFGPKKFDDQA